MSLKGNLAVVNLADVFQMLSRGKSTGLLRVQAPEGARFIELQGGLISLAGRSTQYMQLGDLLLTRKSIDYSKLETALKIHKENGMVLGQVLIEMNYISKTDLESALHFLVEEEICDLFTLREGDFDFLANATLDSKIAPGGGAVRLAVEPDTLMLEAARRVDEWNEIEQRITTQAMLFRLTQEGQNIYRDAESISEEGRTIMRLLQANNTVEGVVQKSCLGRLNTNRMVLELWDAQLIESVPKDEYMKYSKLQLEAGQLSDALRIAVHASKVGAPETIKAAIPAIDNLRKQLAAEEKPSIPMLEKERDKSSATVRRAAGTQSLIIRKEPLPWRKIAIGGVLALLLAGYGAYLFMQPDTHKLALREFEKIKGESIKLLDERHFLDAKRVSGQMLTDDTDIKREAEKFKKLVETKIDTQLIEDIGEFGRKVQNGIGSGDLKELKERLKDYDGWLPTNDLASKALKQVNKQIPLYDVQIREAGFKGRLEDLEKNLANRNSSDEDLSRNFLELLRDDPPEQIAARARQDLYKLQAPRLEAARLLALAHELSSKGGNDSARKIFESLKVRFPGSAFSVQAEMGLKDIENRQLQASDAMAKVHRLILQKKDKEALEALEQLLKSNPPASVLNTALVERRKLDEEIQEAKLAERLRDAARIAESDAKKARQIILNEIIARYPWSLAAWSATLRVEISSSPEGATVTLSSNQGDRILGVTRDSQPLLADLPAMGPLKLTFVLPGFEPYELVESNLRGEKIDAVFIRKPQVATLAPVAATAGMQTLADTLLLAGASELVVCDRNSLQVLRRVNLEGIPLPIKNDNKTEQPPPLQKGELKLRALSVNAEEADAYAFVSCTGPYFFEVLSNGTEFFRIPSQPGAVGEPQMYRPERASASKMIGLISNYGYELLSETRSPKFKGSIPGAGTQEFQEQPFGIAFDKDTFYVARDNNSLYAIDGFRGQTKFEKKCTDRISTPPAVTRDNAYLGIADVKGRLIVLNLKNDGKEFARADFEAPCSLGLSATMDGFLAATDDGNLSLAPVGGGKPSWTVKLPSKALFTPPVFIPGKKARDQSPVAVVCCDQINNSYTVAAIRLRDGALLWRARLSARPVAATFGPDAVYVSTVDNELLKFDIVVAPVQN